jgi:fucose 4-O-acetylase-like acetyltransferase
MDDPEACDESSPLVPTLDPSRDAHLDNCKFFLMLVVVGNHCVQDFLYVVLDTHTGRRWCQQDPVAPGLVLYLVQLLRGVYLYLNLLGMPTFTLISGYCSKVRTKRKHPR